MLTKVNLCLKHMKKIYLKIHHSMHNVLIILVYVSYSDITAEDFLFVQTDLQYRREWDDTAIELEIVDTDEAKGQNSCSLGCSQVIYWEMLW